MRAALCLQDFLLLDERNVVETTAQLNLLKASPLPENVVLRFEDYSASWSCNKENNNSSSSSSSGGGGGANHAAAATALDDVNMTVTRGQLCVVTGYGGSGKSTLLTAPLGDVPRLGGFVRTRGQLGHVPQYNWIFTASFRENIIFGLDMDRRKYNKVLYACDLVKVRARVVRVLCACHTRVAHMAVRNTAVDTNLFLPKVLPLSLLI